MRNILFTNARNEDNILEWIIHHLNIGFTHIHIIDHKSEKPIYDIVQSIQLDNVTVERIDSDIIKTNLMWKVHAYALKENYDWLLYLDADEFLVLNNDSTLESFLQNYEKFDQIGINWLMFGSNNHHDIPNGTILESYTKSDEHLHTHIKAFLHVRHQNARNILSIPNPHVYILNDMSTSIGVDFNQLDSNQPWFYNINKNYDEVPAYIAHYVFQSYNTFIARKINLPRDDTGTFRTLISEEEFHNISNTIINTTVRDRYDEINKNILYNNS
jgi:hypothetical protein